MSNNIKRRAFIKKSSLAGMAGMIGAGFINDSNNPEHQFSLNDKLTQGRAEYEKPDLMFYGNDGKFKIVQLTDTHYISGDARSQQALNNIIEILEAEKPDLVIHTGDIIFGNPAEDSLREVFKPVSKREIPFAVTFGNHDDEFDKSRQELYNILKTIPYNKTSTTSGITGITNYFIRIGVKGSESYNRILYFFDSNSYSTIHGIEGYGHINFDQIAWYRSCSQRFEEDNNKVPVRALAFFHIPLPEHREAARDDRAFLTGTRGEIVCCPDVNSGLFVSMKEMGDIQAVFNGHDHNNDYTVFWNNMFFIYGRFSGSDTVYNDLKPIGVRVIELNSNDDSFRSWIRLADGSLTDNFKYPDDFPKTKDSE